MTMSNTDETLSAILAEMRADKCIPHHIDWANSIEAATNRMRDAYCDLCKEKDEAYDRLLLERDKAIKECAVMREALLAISEIAKKDMATYAYATSVGESCTVKAWSNLIAHFCDWAMEPIPAAHSDTVRVAQKTEKIEQPGGIAAMRAALEEQLRYWNSHVRTREEEEMRKRTEDALGATLRNCDRFATIDEARLEFQKIRGHKVWADIELWDDMDEVGAFARWIFAPSETSKKETDNDKKD